MKRLYRTHIDNEAIFNEDINISDDLKYVEVDKIMAMIDELEQDVNKIRDLLEPFTALTEIKEIYNLTTELSYKLY